MTASLILKRPHGQSSGLPLALFQYAWDAAKRTADKIYIGTKEHAEAFYSPPGLIYALQLACKKHNEITEDQAVDILSFDSSNEATEVVSHCVGYRANEKQVHDFHPLPTDMIIHVLTNEPYKFAPQAVRDMTLDEIATIWVNPDAQGSTQTYSQADQMRAIKDAQQRAEKRRQGIWGEENIWQN